MSDCRIFLVLNCDTACCWWQLASFLDPLSTAPSTSAALLFREFQRAQVNPANTNIHKWFGTLHLSYNQHPQKSTEKVQAKNMTHTHTPHESANGRDLVVNSLDFNSSQEILSSSSEREILSKRSRRSSQRDISPLLKLLLKLICHSPVCHMNIQPPWLWDYHRFSDFEYSGLVQVVWLWNIQFQVDEWMENIRCIFISNKFRYEAA